MWGQSHIPVFLSHWDTLDTNRPKLASIHEKLQRNELVRSSFEVASLHSYSSPPLTAAAPLRCSWDSLIALQVCPRVYWVEEYLWSRHEERRRRRFMGSWVEILLWKLHVEKWGKSWIMGRPDTQLIPDNSESSKRKDAEGRKDEKKRKKNVKTVI